MARKLGGALLLLVLVAGLLVFARSQSGGSSRAISPRPSGPCGRPARGVSSRCTSIPSVADADVLAPSGRIETLEVRSGQDSAKKTDDSIRRPDRDETVPLSAVNAAAPERLARDGAQQLNLTPKRLDYVNYDAEGLGGSYWRAFFKGGATADGNRAGHVVKTAP